MWLVNRPLRWVFDLVVLPFRGMPPIVGLTVISLLVSVGMLIGFRAVSDQDALDAVKRRIYGGVYEIRLYKDDLLTIFAAQLGILRETMTYFRLSMVPMLWMMVPIAILVSQLQFQYGYESLEPGQTALVKVELTEEGAERVATTDGAGVRQRGSVEYVDAVGGFCPEVHGTIYEQLWNQANVRSSDGIHNGSSNGVCAIAWREHDRHAASSNRTVVVELERRTVDRERLQIGYATQSSANVGHLKRVSFWDR